MNGLISFIVHPDYIIDRKPQGTYISLLEELDRLRRANNIWAAAPREVNRWWRQRSQMRIVQGGKSFQIEGPGHQRARLAFASCVDDELRYKLAPQEAMEPSPVQ